MPLGYVSGYFKGPILFEYIEFKSVGKHGGWNITAQKMTVMNNNRCQTLGI